MLFFDIKKLFQTKTEYIAKNIIDNHQGKISFKSEIKKGTKFFIELPLKQKA